MTRKPLQLKRGRLARLQALGLAYGEPALAVDDPTKPKLLVGDVDGNPREVSGGGGARSTITIHASAAAGTVSLGKVFTILKETTTGPGRFRLYRTTAARDADLTRPASTDEAAAQAGCVLEDVFVDSALTIEWCDVPAHSGSDGLCAWSWSGALGATIALDISQTEA